MPEHGNIEYMKLSATSPRTRQRWTQSSVILVIFISLVLVILAAEVVRAVTLPQKRWPITTTVEDEVSPCGNTTAEARARGCAFDLVTYMWSPKDCVDDEINAEYSKYLWESSRCRKPFPLFEDEEGNLPIKDEDALAERVLLPVYVTREAHYAHCLMLWRKVHRAHDTLKAVDTTVSHYNHTIHCTSLMLNQESDPFANETLNKLDRVLMRFTGCVGYNDPWN